MKTTFTHWQGSRTGRAHFLKLLIRGKLFLKYAFSMLLLLSLFSITSWAQTNNALNFDGAGGAMANQDFVSITHNNLLNLNGGDYTLEAWVYPTSGTAETIISKGSGSGSANLDVFFFSIVSNKLFFQLGKVGAGSETGTSNTDVPLNQWSHVAVTYNNSTMTATFYLNGVVDGTHTFSGTLYNADMNPAFIGKQGYSGGSGCDCNPFDGSIDEVRVWSDIRTQKEISLNMNNNLTGSEANLVAYYQFNEGTGNGNNTTLTTVFDKTSNNLDGTLTQMALSGTTSNFVAGFTAVNNALNFDGTDDYVIVPHDASLGITSNITLEAWINTTSNSEQYVTTKGGSSWYLSVNASAGKAGIFLDNVSAAWLFSTSDVNDGNWHHIAATYDGTNVAIYVDGVQENIIAYSGTITTNTNPVYIGRRTTQYFDGNIDELRIWDVARTCAQIRETKDVELTGSETGLVSYYNFNYGTPGGSNTNVTLFDLDATNSNNGTLTNFGTPPLTGTASNWVDGSGNNVSGNSPALQPEINVQGNSMDIATGNTAISANDHTFIPFTAVGASTVRTFTIQNTGSGTLNVSSITSSNANMTVSSVSSVVGGQSTTFNVTFSPTASGSQTSTITINSNDCDEAAYTFEVRGTAASGNANALDFDGASDYVATTVNRNEFTDYTMEAWIQYTGASTAAFQAIIGSETQDFFIGKNTGDANFGIQDNVAQYVGTISTNAFDGNWHHIAVVRTNSTNTVVLYVDGILVYTGTGAFNGAAAGILRIGNEPEGGGYFFTGKIDEVRMWNDVRTQDEIIASMNNELTGSEANLTAYYNFNQGIAGGDNTTELTLLDASPNNKDGTLTGFNTAIDNFSLKDGTTSNYLAGFVKKNNALDFNGTSDYVATTLNRNAVTNYTMEAWIKYEGAAGDGYQPILASTNVDFFIGKNTGNTDFGIQDGNFVGTISSNNAFDGNWHHIAVTRDNGSNTINLYIDGVFVYTGSFSGSMLGTINIGHEPEGGGFFFNGKIDEVRVWSTVRTCAEINAYKNIELTGTETGLVAYYNFNHGTAAGNNTGLTSLPDISTNSNTGTLTSFAGLDGSINSGETSNWVDGSGNNVSGTTPAAQPEINVKGNGVNIVDGDGTPATGDNTDFVSAYAGGGTKTVTYTIENTGTATLNITSIVLGGTTPGDYELGTLPTSVPAGGSATFDVTFKPSSVNTDIGATVTINNSDCDEGVYDFAIQGDGTQGAPGGVTSGLHLWLKADAGVTGTTTVTQWDDQSASGLNATGAGTPSLTANNLNFNPTINFNGTDARFATAATSLFSSNTSPVSMFTIFNTTNNEGQKFLVNQRYNNNNVTNIQLGYDTGLGTGSGNFGLHIGSSIATIAAANTIANNTFYIMSTLILNSGNSPSNINIFQNGTSLALSDDNGGFTNAGSYETTDPNVPIDIGVRNDAFGGSAYGGYHQGEIGEIIIYTNTPSTTERQQIESYLAIKYGLTRTGDYLASNGTTIWNATTGAGYLNDITGIGRDDLSVLHQKQSKSQNSGSMVTMGLGTIATDNASNTNTFASDRTFMIWGNNAGSQDYDASKVTTNLPNGGVDGYLARVWQVQDNGVGAVQLNIDLSGVTISGVTDAGDLVLLISDNASDFSNASVQFADAFASNVATFNNVDFATGTRYFSIGRWKGTADISAEKGNFLNLDGDATKNVLLNSIPLTGVTDNFTVEMWVKRTGTASGYIFYNGSFGTDGYGLTFDGSGYIQPVVGATTVTNSTTVVPLNTWAHVALVRESGTLKLYVNGKEELLGSNPGVITAPTSLSRIGTRTTATFGFNGVIDEVRFWSVARTQTQLRENMHLVSTGSETGLANYYQFNATSGGVLDAVGGIDGTIENSATRETSDCPIGKGRSFTVSNITAAGPHTFTNTGLQVQFAASGIYPEGDVVVTQIDGSGAPTNIPTDINTHSAAYWVVRNYGANSVFSELASIQFTVPNNDLISSADVANPVDLRLFKRASNSGSSDAWTMIGSASAADAGNLTITFNTFDPDFTSFSQVLPATVNSGTSSLPVTLSAFEAKRQDEKTVLVTWQTISEYENAGFEVQRSENGKDFEILGFVDGAGNSQTKLTYRFVDNQATRSAYYRLKQIDNDGEFKYSPVVFVQGIDLQKISVYPNPFTKSLKLDFGSTEPTKLPVSLEIYTAQGKRVLRKVGGVTKVQGALNEQINKLDNGVYLLRVIIGNKVHIKRVVKQ